MKDPEIDERDTARLATRSDVPPEMLRALEALKSEGPSRRTLNVVASRLGNLLDAPPPAAQPAKWLWRGLGARAVAIRVGIAALTIGTAAVWLRPAGQQAESARTPSGTDARRDVASSAVAPNAAAPSALPSSQQAPVPQAAPTAHEATNGLENERASSSRPVDGSGAAVASSADRAAARARSRRTRGTSSSARATSRAVDVPASSGLRSLAEEPHAATDRKAQAAVAAADRSQPQGTPVPAHAEVVGPKPDAGVAHETAEAPEVRLPSEVELMLDARRLAGRDPRAAQRLLEQHAARFPKGVLAPEREVLAIEVLRALGQTAEAEQRLRVFRAQYPNSMHLRRLSASPATPGR